MICPVVEQFDAVYTIGISAHGQNIAGTGIVTTIADRWALTLLAPGGLELFTATGDWTRTAEVRTGLDGWRPYLEGLPFARDLQLLFLNGSCASISETEEGRRWQGKPGRAVFERPGGVPTVTDKRRAYTLRMVGA